jgi:hypothetical protein
MVTTTWNKTLGLARRTALWCKSNLALRGIPTGRKKQKRCGPVDCLSRVDSVHSPAWNNLLHMQSKRSSRWSQYFFWEVPEMAYSIKCMLLVCSQRGKTRARQAVGGTSATVNPIVNERLGKGLRFLGVRLRTSSSGPVCGTEWPRRCVSRKYPVLRRGLRWCARP